MAITVPIAEPITPKWQNLMRIKLNIMFNTDENIKKYKGVTKNAKA